MSITEKENEIVEEFALFDDWMDKYEHLISLARDLPLISEDKKVDDNLVRGCQSRVWLTAKHENGKIFFTADSDAIITKGIVALLVRVLNNENADDIINAKMSFIDEIGLKEHLSPTRSNGLVSMIKEMKTYALAYSNKKD
jgi:cysteine desulfuration protein SufE